MLKRALISILSLSLTVFFALYMGLYLSGEGTLSPVPSSSILSPGYRSSGNSSSFQSSQMQHLVYDILGKSKNLTDLQWKNMLAMRSKVKILAEDNPGRLIINGNPQINSVCLIFDDGPDATITPKIIELLNKNDVKGNFFFSGLNVKKYPEIVKEASESGHLIANHGYDHTDFTKLSLSQMLSQLEQTGNLLKDITGQFPLIVRPPYGGVNQAVVDSLDLNGYKTILWSIDTLDWSEKEMQNIIKNVTDNLRSGDIILMHCDSSKLETLNALQKLIDQISDKGFNITTIDKLLGCQAYR